MLTCLICVLPQLTGQPVLIGGTMGTCSYVLTGTEQGMTETFGTTCHGAVSYENRSSLRKTRFSVVIAFHFEGKYIESESEVAQSCPTLCDPMGRSLQGSSVHGIFQARTLEWVAISFSGDLPDPGIESGSTTLQADDLLTEL